MVVFMGYAHPNYALSFKEFGEPRQLPRCGGWILVRQIPGTPYKDAMGCYPLFSCLDWAKLHEDLEHVCSDLVSLTLVTDPFSGVTPAYLEQCFDIVKTFKTHYVVDLSHPLESFVGKVHRKNARKSLEMMDIEVCCQPIQYLDDWIKLYDNLTRRHKIKGINAFSPKCFEIQLSLPGMLMVLGKQKEKIIGATLILIQNQEIHFHLSAFTDEGYKIRASYGTHWKALVYGCEQGVRYFNLGGAAGITEGRLDGLSEFKRGWSNDRRMAYLCGCIFDQQKYDFICEQYHISNVEYFPVYRAGEFGTGTKKQLL